MMHQNYESAGMKKSSNLEIQSSLDNDRAHECLPCEDRLFYVVVG